MKKLFMPVFIVLLLLPFSASATTYYVSRVDGNDSYNGRYPTYQGGSDGPWLTLAKSVSSISSGDTVYLRGGTWQDEQLDIEYKNYNSITTFKAYPGETPVIDMRNSGTENSAKGIFLKRTDYLYIDGITVRNSGNYAINAEYCDHLTVTNCTTEHSRWSGIYIAASNDIEISYNSVAWTHCKATDHDHDPWEYTFNGECISIAEGCTNGNIHHNTISHGTTIQGGAGGEGLNIKAGCSYIYVHHNTVDLARDDGVESTRYAMGVDAWNTETHHIYFYRNIIKNGSYGIIFDSEDGGYGHHFYAWNNIIIHCGHSGDVPGGGLGFPQYGVEGPLQYCYFWNNIIYDSRYGLYIRHTVTAAPLVAQNNIFYNCSSDTIKWGSGTNQAHFTLDHNLLSATDPKFVNPTAGNFHLQSGSPAIDAGVTIPNVTDDFDGIARPQGAGYDIGAFEYVSVSGPKTYYVDSAIGNDANNCSQALNPSTPKRTVNSIMSCDPGAGEIVKFRGNFTQTIYPSQSGQVLYPFQAIQSVSGSTVTFNQPISGLNPATDYVTVYNSRKGNSGAFAVTSFSGNSVTVNTSFLPLGNFISETAADPGDLSAAILRPVHFTAWDKNNPPVFNTQYQTYHAINQRVVMVSYLHSISGEDYEVWPAIEIDGSDGGNSDYQIIDHLEITNAESPIATESGPGHAFQSNYDIIQFNNVHDYGFPGMASDEGIYFGWAFRPDLHHDYVQIMYNKIGPHKPDYNSTLRIAAEGIELKQSAHNGTVFGNEVVGTHPLGCADPPIRSAGTYSYIANNYIHDIYNNDADIQNPDKIGCGIFVISDRRTNNSQDEAYGSIVENNILANIKDRGITVLDADNVQVLNNVVYNIIPRSNCDYVCAEETAGIFIQNWQGSTLNVVIKNNIVQSSIIGIGRYIWGHDEYPSSIDSDYNLVFNTTYPFRGTISQNTHDLLVDPKFVNPGNDNFHLQSSSPAIDNGTALSDVAIDFDSISRPQGVAYDIGAYEYQSGAAIPGDLDDDGDVDIDDLIIVTGDFGRTSGYDARADTIINGEIDIFDVVFVASRFT